MTAVFVYPCFDGDDMEIAWAQHDLYFGREVPAGYGIAGRYYTLGWWWQVLLTQAERRRLWIPWLHRHYQHLLRAGNFSHKLLQLPHEHIAAYHRWQLRDRKDQSGNDANEKETRLRHLATWCDWVRTELEDLMSDEDALLATAKLILYRPFDASDRWGEALDVMLIERYGFECIAQTWRNRHSVMLAARSRSAGSRPDPSPVAY